MDWTQQTHAMTNAWMETQQKAWQGWLEMAQNAMPTGTAPTSAVSMNGHSAGDAANAKTNATADQTMAQMAATQRAWQQMAASMMQPWQKMGEQMLGGASPLSMQTPDMAAMTELISGYVEQLREQMLAAPTSALESWQSMAQNGSQLWEMYQQQMQAFVQPWMQGWQSNATSFPMLDWASLTPDGMSQTVNESAMQAWDAYAQAFFPFLDAPTLGLNRELEEKIRRGFKAWLTYNQRSVEYRNGVAQALGNVYTRLGERMVQMAEEGKTIESLQALGDLWGEIADPAFNEVFRSEEFIRLQGALLTATMEYRLQQRGLVELLCGIYDIPTRTEVDAAHKANYEQRKQIKTLVKKLDETTAQIEALRVQMGEIEWASQRASSDAKLVREAMGLHQEHNSETNTDPFSEVF